MQQLLRHRHAWLIGTLVVLTPLLLVGLGRYGMWDPWELDVAMGAQGTAEEGAAGADQPQLSMWLVGLGFQALGLGEWAGRIPLALSALLMLVALFCWVRPHAGPRAAAYTLLVVATTPLFSLHARQMFGLAPGLCAATLVTYCAYRLAFAKTVRLPHLAGWTAGLGVSMLVSTMALGVLVGVLPGLVAVSAARLIDVQQRGSRFRDDAQWPWAAGVVLTTVAVTVATVAAVMADQASYSHLLGGAPTGGNPPAFHTPLVRLFHGFAPWSAILPVALAAVMAPSAVGEEEGEAAPEQAPAASQSTDTLGLRLVSVLWAALAIGATLVHASRYGGTTYPALAGLAIVVALFLRDLEAGKSSHWGAAVITCLLTGLLIRDFDLYPGSPVESLNVAEVEVPEAFNPKRYWSALLALFAAASVLTLGVGNREVPLDLRSPYRVLRELWRTGVAQKSWLVVGALLMVGAVVFGVVGVIAPGGLGLSTLGRKIALVALLIPPGLVAAMHGTQVLWALATRMWRFRTLPVLLAALFIGVFVNHVFVPTLSAHLSPKHVYTRFTAIASPSDPLAEYRVGGAGAHYVQTEPTRLNNEAEVVAYLAQEKRVWLTLPARELAAVNRSYRAKQGEHLFVVDDSSERVNLVTNKPLERTSNKNFFATRVLSEAPAMSHPVRVNFEGRIELLGFDLETEHDGYAGAGEAFAITWYFKVLRPITSDQQIFLHIDGYGRRINGDHDPVEGRLSTRLWQAGDVIADRQELKVPSNFGPGRYTMFMGFFSGNNRLKIQSGPNDNDNRAKAGELVVR